MSFELAQKYAELSPCHKRKVGAVVLRGDEVIAYGFNHGLFEECSCSMVEKNSHVLHAESMALVAHKREYEGCVMYVTYTPCDKCEVLIKQKGIKQCFYLDRSGKECKLYPSYMSV